MGWLDLTRFPPGHKASGLTRGRVRGRGPAETVVDRAAKPFLGDRATAIPDRPGRSNARSIRKRLAAASARSLLGAQT